MQVIFFCKIYRLGAAICRDDPKIVIFVALVFPFGADIGDPFSIWREGR
jgi:hypothetical protein